MTADLDLGDVARLYEKSLDDHGVSSKAVGWPTADSHRLRFTKLASVIDASQGPVSINDLGCGYGAFLTYLEEKQCPVGLFRGYEISERMLDMARETVPQAELHLSSQLDLPADYSFACGIFNVRLQQNEQEWIAFIERTLDNLDAFSTRGFAFNLLSTYVDYKDDKLFYGDPLHFFDLCKRRYSRRVALLHDYPLWEWTITVTKT
jgi:SAM-dependent methyltransferase